MTEPDWQSEADSLNAEHDPFADDDEWDAQQERAAAAPSAAGDQR